MSYLNKLIAEKEAKDKYELEEIQLKQAIFDINSMYSLYDGEFLIELREFLNDYERYYTKGSNRDSTSQ